MNAISSETAWCVLRSVTGALIFTLIGLHLARYCKNPEWIVKILNWVFRRLDWLRTFYVWIGALAILGGTWAFFLPIALESGFTKNDDGPVLRQLLIYATGGVLGVITIGETHRKNTLEKTKNERDHIRQVHAEIRQVHAERRSRYTTAIEQLSSDKASIRLGGIYSLVGMVDEWLSDEKTIPSLKERRKEGQVIINNLCAYIRSPFDLISRVKDLSKDKAPGNYKGGIQQFVKDQARLHEEKELRLTILTEIKTRLNGGISNHQDGVQEIYKGSWSDFDYDFSNAHFFYPVNFKSSCFSKFLDFSGAKFTEEVKFPAVTFTRVDFSRTKFSYESTPESYSFNFSSNSHKIEPETHELNGRTFTIPKGAMLFDPDNPYEQDHTRLVHAERRSRYTTAVEHLSSDKASIRLGGVYTLVGLVDEWLADEKTLPSLEERRKEGQVIINSLCAYIRSPFLLAERAEQLDAPYAKDLQEDFDGDKEKFDADKQTFTRDKTAIEEERQVRSTILQKIHERLQSGSKPGPWSDFDYNFSSTHFFYPVNFKSSCFSKFLDFSGAKFTDKTDFSKSTFIGDISFSGVTFAKTSFSAAIFIQIADFSKATFTERADFSEVKFTERADFSRAKFTGYASFFEATFTQANFSEAKFTERADFSGATFTETDFSETTFTQEAYFFEATFTQANFIWATFTQRANFIEATFTQANFIEATFTEHADFSGAIFHSEPSFTDVLGKARFSHKVAPESYSFGVDPDSPCKIDIEEQEHNGTKFIIPKGTILFDPDELSEQEDNDSNDS